MSDSLTAIARCLRRRGLRSTRSGRTVLLALRRLQRPATAKDLYRAVGPRGGDLATVHRLLARFEQAGLVRSTHLHDKSRWYELARNGVHYHHLVCLRCRRIERFCYCAVERLEKMALREYGFQVQSHSVELFGLCRQCRPKGG